MMLARDAAITILDFESTGVVEGFANEPWQIGMVFFQDGKIQPQYTFSSLLRVGDRPFNRYAPGRHALLREKIAQAPTMQELWIQLSPWLSGHPLGAHSIPTEKKFLGEAFPLHPFGPWVDTLKLVRVAYPEMASHKLEDVIVSLELRDMVQAFCPDGQPHDALYDAVACAVLLEFLLQLPEWRDVPLNALIRARATNYHQMRSARAAAKLGRHNL